MEQNRTKKKKRREENREQKRIEWNTKEEIRTEQTKNVSEENIFKKNRIQ